MIRFFLFFLFFLLFTGNTKAQLSLENRALIKAIMKSDTVEISESLKAGAILNSSNCPLDDDDPTYSPLFSAVINDNIDVLKFLHHKGLTLNACNNMALPLAVKFGNIASLKYLINVGLSRDWNARYLIHETIQGFSHDLRLQYGNYFYLMSLSEDQFKEVLYCIGFLQQKYFNF
jgi:hypothetical protein